MIITNCFQDLLRGFYREIHACFKGKGASKLAWEVIEAAFTGSQTDTYIVVEIAQESQVIVDRDRLDAVLEKYGFTDIVELDA